MRTFKETVQSRIEKALWFTHLRVVPNTYELKRRRSDECSRYFFPFDETG